MKINTFDIDGVINMGSFDGLYPGPNDIIITGRSHEETPETEKMLQRKGIENLVYFNPLSFDEKTRESSGIHKGNTIKQLIEEGYDVQIHFEDDIIQAKQISLIVPEVNVVMVVHDLVEKENVRHLE